MHVLDDGHIYHKDNKATTRKAVRDTMKLRAMGTREIFRAVLTTAFAALLSSSAAFAQSGSNKLTDTDREAIKEETARRVSQLETQMNLMANSKTPAARKQAYRSACRLFINEAQAYLETYGTQKIKRDGVRVEVTSQIMGVISRPLVRVYFMRLINKLRHLYEDVKFQFADNCVVSKPQRVGDHWEATVTIYQKFYGSMGDGRYYADYTTKTIKTEIRRHSDDEVGSWWDIRLGDIHVESTRALTKEELYELM